MSNLNSKIKTRQTRNGKTRTEVVRDYDSEVTFAASTLPEDNATTVFINVGGSSNVRLTGRQARTLYRVMQSHYRALDKTW